MATPTEAQVARIEQAIIGKAVRFLALPGAPFGAFGETGEWGGLVISVMGDAAVKELLFGLSYLELDLDDIDVTVDDVVAAGLKADSVPSAKEAEIERAITAAKDWIGHHLNGLGFA
jgi:hypothetical protein